MMSWTLRASGQARLPAFPGNQRYRPHQDQGEIAANKWHLRALSQDRAAGVLSGRIPQKTLRQHRCAAGRSRRLAASLQPRTHSLRQNVLRQNAVPDHDRGQGNLEGKVRELNFTRRRPPEKRPTVRSQRNHYTFAHTNRHDFRGFVDELVPGVACRIDDCLRNCRSRGSTGRSRPIGESDGVNLRRGGGRAMRNRRSGGVEVTRNLRFSSSAGSPAPRGVSQPVVELARPFSPGGTGVVAGGVGISRCCRQV